jgi:hypothetical protein
MESVPTFRANPVSMGTPNVYHLPSWDGISDPERLKVIRQIVYQYGRDPRVTSKAIEILRQHGIEPRNYREQAACLLKWVQTNVYYVNEPGERLQSPLYTLKVGYGDCDDMSILLCSFFEAIRLPWKMVISGVKDGKFIRYHEGDKHYPQTVYSHIYCMVGNKPFTPSKWYYCEPTLQAPFGWDVVQASKGKGASLKSLMPEFAGADSQLSSIFKPSQSITAFLRSKTGKIVESALIAALTAIMVELLLDRIRSTRFHAKYIKPQKEK